LTCEAPSDIAPVSDL
jgi:hypothetical protein